MIIITAEQTKKVFPNLRRDTVESEPYLLGEQSRLWNEMLDKGFTPARQAELQRGQKILNEVYGHDYCLEVGDE